MTSTTGRRVPVLIDELMSWVGSAAPDPTIRLEEYDEDGRHVVRADIPGIDPDKDIHLTIDRGVLRLTGERRAEKHEGHRSEIRFGAFERTIPLPRDADADDVVADYADGVLTVSMPSARAADPQVVPVRHREPSAG